MVRNSKVHQHHNDYLKLCKEHGQITRPAPADHCEPLAITFTHTHPRTPKRGTPGYMITCFSGRLRRRGRGGGGRRRGPLRRAQEAAASGIMILLVLFLDFVYHSRVEHFEDLDQGTF